MDKQLLRAYYNEQTVGPRSGCELQLQRDLTALDKGLHLRWNPSQKHWTVYYDHNGLMSGIRTFNPGDSFREVYQSIARNGKTTKRDLIFQHKESVEWNERQAQKSIAEAQHQASHELGNMAKGRVISMQTDSSKPGCIVG